MLLDLMDNTANTSLNSDRSTSQIVYIQLSGCASDKRGTALFKKLAAWPFR